MDPNATLDAIRDGIEAYECGDDSAIGDIVEHVLALDEWLAKGGFLPRSWEG